MRTIKDRVTVLIPKSIVDEIKKQDVERSNDYVGLLTVDHANSNKYVVTGISFPGQYYRVDHVVIKDELPDKPNLCILVRHLKKRPVPRIDYTTQKLSHIFVLIDPEESKAFVDEYDAELILED